MGNEFPPMMIHMIAIGEKTGELPDMLTNVAETYVHRIGRTARAGASGIALSFCDHEEKADLRAIERLLRRAIEVRNDHPEYPHRDEGAFEEKRTNGQSAAQRAATGGAGTHGLRPTRQYRPVGSQQGQRAATSGGNRPQEENRGGSGSRSRGRRRPRRGYGRKKSTV